MAEEVNFEQLNSALSEIVESVAEFQRIRVRGLAAIRRAHMLGILSQGEAGFACIDLPSNRLQRPNSHLTSASVQALANTLVALNQQLEANQFAGDRSIAAVIA